MARPELVVNLKTARATGVTISKAIFSLAHHVVE
jgi:ABC-type uncharacterized transport system substrate-binding protein